MKVTGMKQKIDIVSADSACYESHALKEYIDYPDRIMLVLQINPNPYRIKYTEIVSLLNNHSSFDQIKNMIPDDLKKLLTPEFFKIYQALCGDDSSYEKVKLKDGNDYDRGHPYIIVVDAYTKGFIDEKHPLLILMNARFKRQTGMDLIIIKTEKILPQHAARKENSLRKLIALILDDQYDGKTNIQGRGLPAVYSNHAKKRKIDLSEETIRGIINESLKHLPD